MSRELKLAIRLSSFAVAAGLLCGSPARADLLGFWPFDTQAGNQSPNAAPGGTPATLAGDAAVMPDPTRTFALTLDGTGDRADAGTLPSIGPAGDFTWSFFANQGAAGANTVIVGNRQPDAGWIKFTPNAFEFRDITPTHNGSIDYADIPANSGWQHHAVVKRGDRMTYYRDGAALGASTVTGTISTPPLYFGGDATAGENWVGRIDDVGIRNDRIARVGVVGLARGTFTPVNVPLVQSVITPLTEAFDGPNLNTAKWTPTNRGLENNAPAGYNPPAVGGGQVTLGGTTNNQFWYGNSIESVQSIDGRLATTVSARRVALSGTGSAFRSSLWLVGDDGHYVHFAQNIGESNWSINVRDDGGTGTLTPTGGGTTVLNNNDLGSHEMTLIYVPRGESGDANIEVYLDGVPLRTVTVTNWPDTFKVVLTGQARATGDTVSAVFDDVLVQQEVIPEPGGLGLLAAALLGLARRPRRRAAALD